MNLYIAALIVIAGLGVSLMEIYREKAKTEKERKIRRRLLVLTLVFIAIITFLYNKIQIDENKELMDKQQIIYNNTLRIYDAILARFYTQLDPKESRIYHEQTGCFYTGKDDTKINLHLNNIDDKGKWVDVQVDVLNVNKDGITSKKTIYKNQKIRIPNSFIKFINNNYEYIIILQDIDVDPEKQKDEWGQFYVGRRLYSSEALLVN